MEKTKLINLAARHINEAAARNAAGELEAADEALANLFELLTMELAGSAPTDKKKPEESDKT